MTRVNPILSLAASRLASTGPFMRRIVESAVSNYHRQLGVGGDKPEGTSVQTRVRKAESDPDRWALDYRESEHESWDTVPRRFHHRSDAEIAEQQLATRLLHGPASER